jgi:hypothetical protein
VPSKNVAALSKLPEAELIERKKNGAAFFAARLEKFGYPYLLDRNVDSFTRHLPVSQALQRYFAQGSNIARRMASDPPLKGLRVLELAGLAPGALFNRNSN